eukprot:12553218-Ditylum_brightwellii.AAC.1
MHNWQATQLPFQGWKNKEDFCYDDIVEEEQEVLDCDSNIDVEEIGNLHNISQVSKEVKLKYKEDEDAVMDDSWIN